MHGKLGVRKLLCVTSILAGVTAVQADGITTTIGGFGTVGGSFTSDSNYAYRHDSGEFQGASNDFNIGLESRLGVQATFDFGEGLSITAQEVGRERGDKTFDLGTEWLYAQYAPNSDLKLRIGRVALDTFLESDSRLVGYAAPWFRAPNEVYAYEPFYYVDGGQVFWHKNLGKFGLEFESAYGTTSTNIESSGLSFVSTAHGVFNCSVAVEYGDVLLRIARTELVIPTSLPLSAQYTLNFNIHDKFTSVGFQYDDGTALVLSEWTKRAENIVPLVNEPVAAGTAWYVAAGWHLGKFTPLAMFANSKPDPSLATQAGSFNAETLSLRYDVVHNVALKAEVTRASANNFLYWITYTPTAAEHVNIYSLGADFVF